MPQSFSSVLVHAVFSTRERNPWISSPPELHAYIGGVFKRLGCQPLIVGGVADDVHVVAAMSRIVTIADWVKEVKRVSSVHMKSAVPEFGWQNGYGAFSVDRTNVDGVRAYIANQAEHHRSVSFQEEYREILREHGIEWDERYVWE